MDYKFGEYIKKKESDFLGRKVNNNDLIRISDANNYFNSYKKQFVITDVGNWVAIESNEQPEIMTDVMVKYKDGRKEVAYFDGDKRFYIEKDDRDITETIVEWHKLP